MPHGVQELRAETFNATINLGLQKGYSDDVIEREEVCFFIREYQIKWIRVGNCLSASISNSAVIFAGQIKPHVQISFINYPRFPMERSVFKSLIERLAKDMMNAFGQHRMVVEFTDETVMLQKSDSIDPRIYK